MLIQEINKYFSCLLWVFIFVHAHVWLEIKPCKVSRKRSKATAGIQAKVFLPYFKQSNIPQQNQLLINIFIHAEKVVLNSCKVGHNLINWKYQDYICTIIISTTHIYFSLCQNKKKGKTFFSVKLPSPQIFHPTVCVNNSQSFIGDNDINHHTRYE